jgi:hypothetical protein
MWMRDLFRRQRQSAASKLSCGSLAEKSQESLSTPSATESQMSEEPLILSDWYELVRGETLEQGDIFDACPVFRPPSDLPCPIDQNYESLEFTGSLMDAVVMSQSCDIAPCQKSDMWLVLFCPVWELSAAAKVNPFLTSGFGKEECRRGHLPGYHMIDGCQNGRLQRGISIVSFREVWSLPLNFVRQMAAKSGPRLRMRPPYKEHLAQAFARYFMRVGLPADIEPFKSETAEREIMKKLGALDEETRKRVLAAFS